MAIFRACARIPKDEQDKSVIEGQPSQGEWLGGKPNAGLWCSLKRKFTCLKQDNKENQSLSEREDIEEGDDWWPEFDLPPITTAQDCPNSCHHVPQQNVVTNYCNKPLQECAQESTVVVPVDSHLGNTCVHVGK